MKRSNSLTSWIVVSSLRLSSVPHVMPFHDRTQVCPDLYHLDPPCYGGPRLLEDIGFCGAMYGCSLMYLSLDPVFV